MGKLKVAGQNLGRVFNFRYGRLFEPCTFFTTAKLSILIWKTRPKQLLGYLPSAVALPGPTMEPHLCILT